MHRSLFVVAASLAVLVGCHSDPSEPLPEVAVAVEAQALGAIAVTRERVAGDIFHHGFVVRVGSTPNAQLHIHRVVRERAPWQPRRTTGAIMLLHGDFATFETNFAPGLGEPASSAPGLAPWLAERGIDVWGVSRRWTQAPRVGADVSDFDAMGLDQELDDTAVALAFARAVRLITDGSLERMTLAGFSRGGQLAYFYASREATRPAELRHVKGLVPLDVYASLAPEDEELRQFFCDTAAFEYQLLADGITDGPNDFQIDVGQLRLTAPDEPTPSPFFPGFTNRQVMLAFVGRTFLFFLASPSYHLAAPVLGERVLGLRSSSEDVIARWLAGSAPHQSIREQADTDALTCGDAPLPADLPLSRIRIPLLLIAAAGGYGAHALHSTTQVSSTDVTTRVVRELPVEREAEDFGHADLLFSPDAPRLAWEPLLAWLRAR